MNAVAEIFVIFCLLFWMEYSVVENNDGETEIVNAKAKSVCYLVTI